MTSFAVTPIHPGTGPATAVSVTADEATSRDALADFARTCSVADFTVLREAAQQYDAAVVEYGVEATEPWQVALDRALDHVARRAQTLITHLWRLRVGVEEVGALQSEIAVALTAKAERGAA